MTRTAAVSLAVAALLGAPLLCEAQNPPRQQVEHVDPEEEAQWGYSQAIEVGGTIYLSGTIGEGTTLQEQLPSAYASIKQTLTRYGATMQDVVKETVYTTDMVALAAANPLRKQAYGGHAPAATWVQIARLLSKRAVLEIEVTAVKASGPAPAP